MLRITKEQENGSGVTLKLEGKITDQWAALLEGECRLLLRHDKQLQLDFAGVTYVDEGGLDVLHSLPSRVRIVNAPGFIAELLRTGG
jgi:anti-anti-sigma regulatory factor